MIKKKLFYKKSTNISKKYFFFLIFFIVTPSIYFYFIDKSTFFNIPPNFNSFYIIPMDKGGQIINHQEKKILNLTYNNKDNINLINDPNLEYSIQLYTSDDYKFIINYRNKLTNGNDSIFLPEDLFVAILNYDLSSEYLLLFKNFNSRKNAFEYCKKYSYYLDKCIIVNVKNLD